MSNDQIAPSESSLQGQYAGFVSRLIALIIDVLLVISMLIIIGLTAQLIMGFFRLDELLASLVDNLTQQFNVVGSIIRFLTAIGSFYFIFFLYYITLHTVAGGITVGKAIMGLRVVRMDGIPLTIGRSTRRYVTFLLSALPLFLGQLWVIIDDRRQGWHDKWSNTCVIYDWPAQEDESFLSGLRNRLRYVQETRRRFGIGSGSANEEPAEAETAVSDSVT